MYTLDVVLVERIDNFRIFSENCCSVIMSLVFTQKQAAKRNRIRKGYTMREIR